MARFRYKLQGILQIKEKLENQAKLEFAAAKAALDREEEALARLKSRRREYERQGRELRQGVLDFLELDFNYSAILHIKERIVWQKGQVELARQRLEERRQALEDVMKERKTHENLREKAWDSFWKEELHKEGVESDELTSYRYGRGLLAGRVRRSL